MIKIQLCSCPMVLTSSGLLSVPMAMRELYSFSRSCRAWMWNKHSSHVINPDRSRVMSSRCFHLWSSYCFETWWINRVCFFSFSLSLHLLYKETPCIYCKYKGCRYINMSAFEVKKTNGIRCCKHINVSTISYVCIQVANLREKLQFRIKTICK